ncbi:MAG: creatininase family protein [Chloroflexi bacterium]|nr:creatininase family protein [Chloroflexota bacterium]
MPSSCRSSDRTHRLATIACLLKMRQLAGIGGSTSSQWPEQVYRRYSVDVHIPDWDPLLLANFDAAQYVGDIARGGAQSLLQYTNSRVGLCLWNAQVGPRHANMPQGRDFFGEVVGECRRSTRHEAGYQKRGFMNTPMDADREVQWERLLPVEFRAAQQALPVVYLPLGTVEWHGEHNALGLDALKAHQLCVLAARAGGGVVHPPLYGGMGGLDMPATVVVEGEHEWDNHLLRPWLEKLCGEFHRQGFSAIIMLTGHYGHNQQITVREVGARMTERLQIPVLGTPEYWLAQDAGYLGDHAGIGETSLLMHLHPDLVKIERIRTDPDYGRTDAIEKGASAELGRKYASLIVERLAKLARAMPGWDDPTREAFVRAERALISAQVKGWRTRDAWAAWRKTSSGEFTMYGAYLAAGEFERIERMASHLL